MGGHATDHEKKELKGPARHIVAFLESPSGLALLFALLVIDVLIVAVSGVLDIQYINSERRDCKDYVKECMPIVSSRRRRSRRLDELDPTDNILVGVDSIYNYAAAALLDERRLASGCDRNPDDPHFGNHTLHDVEKVLAYISIGILVIFFIEQLLDIAAMRWNYFSNKMHVLDFVVILVSLALEILVTHLPLGGLLIVVRVWRFTRTAHGTVELKHSYKQVVPLAESAMKADFEEIWQKVSLDRWRELENSTEPNTVKADEITLVRELSQTKPELLVRCLAFEHARLVITRRSSAGSDHQSFSPRDIINPVKVKDHIHSHLKDALPDFEAHAGGHGKSPPPPEGA